MGRLNGHEKEDGFILLDALVALVIVAIGFAVFLGALSLAGSLSLHHAERVQSMIEQRNRDATEQTVLYEHK